MADAQTEVINGSQDLGTIRDFVNLPEGSEVYPRLLPSTNIGTLSGVRKAIFEAGGLPAVPFSTVALMTASALLDKKIALVTDDADETKNGYYEKRAGAWVKTKWQGGGTDNTAVFDLVAEMIAATKTAKTVLGANYTDTQVAGNNRFIGASYAGFYDQTTTKINFNKVVCATYNATATRVNYRLYTGDQIAANNTIPNTSNFTASGVCESFPKSIATGGTATITLDKLLSVRANTKFAIVFVGDNSETMNVGYFAPPPPAGVVSKPMLYSDKKTAIWTTTIGLSIDAYVQAGFRLILDFTSGAAAPEPVPVPVSTQELLLPPRFYATQGIETNLYFKHTVPNDFKQFEFDVVCSKGFQRLKRWKIQPTAADAAGDFPLSLLCIDKRTELTIASAESVLQIVPPTANAGITKKVLMIGDSWTAANVTTQTLLDNAVADAMKVTLIGTKGNTSTNKHEGRGGWTVARYNTADADNAFWNAATSKFDFPYYLSSQSQAAPDVVIIQLGINDAVSSFSPDRAITAFNDAKPQLDAMIASIKLSNASVKIGISINATMGDQNAWDYSSGMTAHQAQRNMFNWNRECIKYYKGKESQGIYIVGTGYGLDVENNFPIETLTVNARSTKTETTQADPYHAVKEGYQQMGDQLFCWIKST